MMKVRLATLDEYGELTQVVMPVWARNFRSRFYRLYRRFRPGLSRREFLGNYAYREHFGPWSVDSVFAELDKLWDLRTPEVRYEEIPSEYVRYSQARDHVGEDIADDDDV